jgi:L-ascorbate metabolism protein UlaG (beta-lactamase superfamily)
MPKIKIDFYGHAMFTVNYLDEGFTVGFDPYNEQVKSRLPQVSASVVLVSHDHFDHSNVSIFEGTPEVIKDTGIYHFNSIEIEGIHSFHDKSGGSKRGTNIIFILRLPDIKIVHLGDLGDIPPKEVLDALRDTDILMIPVGGVYTIDHEEALQLVRQINPAIAIPMHFKERDTKIDVNSIHGFEELSKKIYPVKRLKHVFEVEKDNLPSETEVLIISSVD